jgi:hypothetical protein
MFQPAEKEERVFFDKEHALFFSQVTLPDGRPFCRFSVAGCSHAGYFFTGFCETTSSEKTKIFLQKPETEKTKMHLFRR